ncbi:heavy-metal-associated domain-containing protein [Flavobacterium myungsuense]|uniref:Heavy-metal-associated domain-containing protein n=1 Tax=Flavobacterium myungsuense TaxID=651823 RepID=A0ABW3J3G6_9FLAO
MKIEKIKIANLKCEGCETTIKKGLLKIDGVSSVKIDNDKDTVTVTYDDNLDRVKIINKLHSLGYPEATEENGLLLKLKSYASCLIGKIDNL